MDSRFGILVAIFVSTVLGGALALRFKDKLHLVMGFSAGALISVAFFDLMPEAFGLAQQHGTGVPIPLALGGGFLAYLLLDRLNILHPHDPNGCENVHHRGVLGALSLSLHSFLDGFIVGLALTMAPSIGVIVALAVLGHRFSDGINVMTMVLRGGATKMQARRWLFTVALTPGLGMLLALVFTVGESSLAPILGAFGGFFIYLGASDLLPESHHAHPKRLTTVATLLGMAALYGIIQIAR